MRINRKKHGELTELQKKKANCRSKTHVYLKRGKIKKSNCVICGCNEVEAHHENYNKPLEVIWVCKNHHKMYHLGLINIT